MTAGQQVQFTITAISNGALQFYLYNPSSRSIALNELSQAFYAYPVYEGSPPWTYNFTPAVSGTYYVSVQATGTSQSYTLSVATTGQTFGNGSVADDIPGTALAVGNSSTSTVDSNTKVRDV